MHEMLAILLVFVLVILNEVSTAAAAAKGTNANNFSNRETPAARVVYTTPFITSQISKYGQGMEGTSVHSTGRTFATAYGGGTLNGMGTIARPDGAVHQEMFSIDQTGSRSYNGLRFLPLSKVVSHTKPSLLYKSLRITGIYFYSSKTDYFKNVVIMTLSEGVVLLLVF
jgi:hypothetical protein